MEFKLLMRTETQRLLESSSRVAKLAQTRAVRCRQYVLIAVFSLMITMGVVGTAAATQTSNSSHYSVTETQFGGGSQQEQCGSQYCAKSSAGDLTVGGTNSTSFSALSGSNTTDQPLLEVITVGGNQNLGVLEQDSTATATAVVKVRNYLMQGYAIEMAGSPPKYGTHALNPLSVPTASQPGHEQFGINLVANSTPAIGANPVKAPSGDSALSYITSGYSNADQYKYIDEDIVAENYTESGEVHYTISMILNISGVTPGGQYASTFSAVVVPLY
jgi:hypothetical protein